MALTDNLIAAWKFDGNKNDSHGGYHLTQVGSVSYVPGKDGQSIQFPSSGTNYLYNSSFPAPGTNFFSVSLWYRLTTTSDSASTLFHMTASLNTYRFFSVRWTSWSGLEARFGWQENSAGTYINTHTVSVYEQNTATDTNWHHVVAVVDLNGGKTRITLYKDGAFLSSKTDSNYDYSFPSSYFCGVVFGVESSWADPCFAVTGSQAANIEIDEAYYWHRALSSSDVSELYNGGAGTFYSSASTSHYAARRLLLAS